MNRHIFAYILLIMAGIGSQTLAQEQAKEQVLTLSDCIDYALKNSYDLRKAALDVQETEAAHKENKGAMFPQLLGAAFLEDSKAGSEKQWNSSAGVELEQVIFDANLFSGIKISRNAKELARLREQMTREELIYNIGNAYSDIIYSQKLLETNRLTLSIMDSIYKKTELQVAQKVTRGIDLNRMKVNISNMNVDIQKTLATITQQKNYLKVLIGMPINSDFKVETSIGGSIFSDSTDVSSDIRAQKTIDLHEKTDIKVLDKEKTAASLEINQIRNAYLPTLMFGASYGYNYQSPKFNLGEKKYWQDGASIKLTLSVPIFDGLQKHQKIKQAQFRLQKAQEDIKQIEQNILSDRENYHLQLLAGFNAVKAQWENTEVAKNTYQHGIMLYEEGLYSITELLDTEREYREAQTAYTYELVNYHKTLLDLMKAEGTLLDLIRAKKEDI